MKVGCAHKLTPYIVDNMMAAVRKLIPHAQFLWKWN